MSFLSVLICLTIPSLYNTLDQSRDVSDLVLEAAVIALFAVTPGFVPNIDHPTHSVALPDYFVCAAPLSSSSQRGPASNIAQLSLPWPAL